ncbi:transposase [Candidatus Methylacidiphilum fumarolicum]|uniref:Transposase n=2 Tax=Candidatus Methylacidiphilum fumarolicum TaxID=591154 RepID=A0ABM9IDF8_9BACT|nr:transposase [Candidatus Methylacidiphilum fumarolicum]
MLATVQRRLMMNASPAGLPVLGPVERKVTYRLYPSKTVREELFRTRWVHCFLWNLALEERRRAWKEEKRSIGFAEQCRWLTELRSCSALLSSINAQSAQVTLKRLDLAFQAFFRRIRQGEKPGFPRFKHPGRFSGFGFKQHEGDWRLIARERSAHLKLRLSGIGEIPIRGKARTPGEPRTCEIFLSGGRWHASVTMRCRPAREHGCGAEAFDLGTERFLTSARLEPGKSEPVVFEVANPRHLRKALKKLRKLGRTISRKMEAAIRKHGKRKGFRISKRLRKQYELLARMHAKVANVRKDFLHKQSAAMVRRSGLLITEELEPKRMTASARGSQKKPGKRVRQKAGLNREMLDASFGAFGAMVGYKAEEAGIGYLEAQARTLKPSQRCHRCGGVVEKTLGDRWHECACGASCHRDENSALGLLDWGLAKWEKDHGFAFPGPKVDGNGKEWTGTDPCVEREALAGWNLAAGWKSGAMHTPVKLTAGKRETPSQSR